MSARPGGRGVGVLIIDTKKPSPKRIVAIGIVVAAIAAVFLYIRSTTSIVEMGRGTIRSLDVAKRQASVEVIVPATGLTRELQGEISADCAIEIDGKPASLGDLRVGDSVEVRARIDRSRGPDGKRKVRFTAEQVRCTRVAVAER